MACVGRTYGERFDFCLFIVFVGRYLRPSSSSSSSVSTLYWLMAVAAKNANVVRFAFPSIDIDELAAKRYNIKVRFNVFLETESF